MSFFEFRISDRSVLLFPVENKIRRDVSDGYIHLRGDNAQVSNPKRVAPIRFVRIFLALIHADMAGGIYDSESFI